MDIDRKTTGRVGRAAGVATALALGLLAAGPAGPAGATPRTSATVSGDTLFVRGSNRALVSYALDERTGTFVVLCVIDNLVKGAAGQAVQCMNLMHGWDEVTGLGAAPVFP